MTVCWDRAIVSFLTRLGLSQALAGFEADMLVMNPDWEQKEVPDALVELVKNLSPPNLVRDDRDEDMAAPSERSLDERKLDYVHLANNATPRSQTTTNKSISAFIAQNRAKNDASNRAEFVYTLAQRRRRLSNDPGNRGLPDLPSCARTDAKPIDRDVQMKYDIAKNEEGPLRRTVRHPERTAAGKGDEKVKEPDVRGSVGRDGAEALSSDKHPGLDERLANVENHLSVRYVPSPPQTLLDRLKFLENHLVRLERDYPPWAALHFNQPNRGWPPPPRSTPIIVPPHMRLSTRDTSEASGPSRARVDASNRGTKLKDSSLRRAVLERLEVQQAISDLAGGSTAV